MTQIPPIANQCLQLAGISGWVVRGGLQSSFELSPLCLSSLLVYCPQKVEFNLGWGREPLLAERSALAVVTFATDRHRYSGEQLANVLTSEGFLCYCDEQNKVR